MTKYTKRAFNDIFNYLRDDDDDDDETKGENDD